MDFRAGSLLQNIFGIHVCRAVKEPGAERRRRGTQTPSPQRQQSVLKGARAWHGPSWVVGKELSFLGLTQTGHGRGCPMGLVDVGCSFSQQPWSGRVFSCDLLASDPVSIGGMGAFVLKESSRHAPQCPQLGGGRRRYSYMLIRKKWEF